MRPSDPWAPGHICGYHILRTLDFSKEDVALAEAMSLKRTDGTGEGPLRVMIKVRGVGKRMCIVCLHNLRWHD